MKEHNITINGILHVGSHDCEEIDIYNKLNVSNDNIVWIDAIDEKVNSCINRGIKNVYKAVISDNDDEDVVFNITNNIMSSSIFEFGTHSQHHPDVYVINKRIEKTVTLNTFYTNNNLYKYNINMWNFDIQGAELKALYGSGKLLENIDILYLEVNFEEIYKNCGLVSEIDKFLENFKFKRIYTHRTQYNWGDAIYIKRNM